MTGREPLLSPALLIPTITATLLNQLVSTGEVFLLDLSPASAGLISLASLVKILSALPSVTWLNVAVVSRYVWTYPVISPSNSYSPNASLVLLPPTLTAPQASHVAAARTSRPSL